MCASYLGKTPEDEMREAMDVREGHQSNLRKERRARQLAQKRQEIMEEQEDQPVNPQQELARRTYEDPSKQRRYNRAYEKAQGMSQAELIDKYAAGNVSRKERDYYGDSTAKFAEDKQYGNWKIKDLDGDTLTKLKANENNAWTNVFDTAKDFTFNHKMLDPQYAAWTGIRRGTNVYKGKFNDDEYDDIIEVDDDGDIRTYNGYTIRPSKQGLYHDYFNEVRAVGKEGKPHYDVSYRDWEEEKRKEFAKLDGEKRKEANAMLKRNNMGGLKVKEKSINEQIKDYIKSEGVHDYVISFLSRVENIPLTVLKKSLSITILTSQLVRGFLHAYFGALKGTKEDDKIVQKLLRICNSKKTTPYIKEDILAKLKEFVKNERIGQIGKTIFNTLIINKNYQLCVGSVYEYVPVDQQLKAKCGAALAKSISDSESRRIYMLQNRQGKTNPMLDYQQ